VPVLPSDIDKPTSLPERPRETHSPIELQFETGADLMAEIDEQKVAQIPESEKHEEPSNFENPFELANEEPSKAEPSDDLDSEKIPPLFLLPDLETEEEEEVEIKLESLCKEMFPLSDDSSNSVPDD
jgi:hypothetical protein